jgi:predicted Zn-dependent protease
VLFAGACAKNPVTGKHELSLVSSAEVTRASQESHAALVKEIGIYTDPALQAYVDSVGWRLADVSHQPSLSWSFLILDTPVPNAYSLSDGHVYVTRGLMAYLASEAQLAGVLGHEIGHVTRRHVAESMTRQLLGGLGLAIGSLGSAGVGIAGRAAQGTLDVVLLRFNREQEDQADDLAVACANKAGYDVREIPRVYAALSRLEEDRNRVPTFLATHPDVVSREERIAKLSDEMARKDRPTVGESPYLRHLEGLVFGQDPRRGYFQAEKYYDLVRKFQVTLPVGWNYYGEPGTIIAVEPNEHAAVKVSYVSTLEQNPESLAVHRHGSVRGERSTIGGAEGWVGLGSRDNAGDPFKMNGYLPVSGISMLEFVGVSVKEDDWLKTCLHRVLGSVERLEKERANPEPARIHLLTTERPGPFDLQVGLAGPQALDLRRTAVLNGVQSGDEIETGHLLKIVLRERLR